MLTKERIGLISGPWVFILIQLFFQSESLSSEGLSVLAITAWMAIWWITEAIAIEATALLPLILFPLLGVADISATGASYAHKFIFLFLGGFMIALAIEKWNLHKRIALQIIRIVGTSLTKVILGFMISTAFLSMWISNTATTVMILPIGTAVVAKLGEGLGNIEKGRFRKALMLSIAYSASIGGMATLIGTPPNLVFAGVVQELYDIEISFMQWFSFGLPISILLIYLSWSYLTRYAFPLKGQEFEGGTGVVKTQLEELGKMSRQEKMVLSIFGLVALAWVTRSFLLVKLFPSIDDSIIALIGAMLLFMIPSGEKKTPLLEWPDLVKLPWGILLLFGGGIALALGFQTQRFGSMGWGTTQRPARRTRLLPSVGDHCHRELHDRDHFQYRYNCDPSAHPRRSCAHYGGASFLAACRSYSGRFLCLYVAGCHGAKCLGVRIGILEDQRYDQSGGVVEFYIDPAIDLDRLFLSAFSLGI